MTFSKALKLLKKGILMRRQGWNGKGMYLEIMHPSWGVTMTKPFIFIKTADGGLVPWVASQTDLLSDDWIEA